MESHSREKYVVKHIRMRKNVIHVQKVKVVLKNIFFGKFCYFCE